MLYEILFVIGLGGNLELARTPPAEPTPIETTVPTQDIDPEDIGEVAPEPLPVPEPSIIEISEPAETTPPTAAPYCDGNLKQAGLIICHAAPGTEFKVAGKSATADNTGTVQIGLTRDAPSVIGWSASDGSFGDLQIGKREDKFRKIEGLDCDKVDARTDAQKAHAGRSWETKVAAFATFNDGQGAIEGFIIPSEGRPTSPFGPTRKYIGVSKVTGEPCDKTSVHRGYDLGTPIGTPVIAPAAGTIILADEDLYYEGGTVFLDHGHGLVSVMMHLSSVDVNVGDVVAQGDLIAKTGNTGRTTGPHLHWAVKWRDQSSKNRKSDYYIDPELLLDLPLKE